jgi:hypothetical protein
MELSACSPLSVWLPTARSAGLEKKSRRVLRYAKRKQVELRAAGFGPAILDE